MRIGIHARTKGSLASAVTYAAEVGAECLQVFAKSPQRWAASPLDPAVCTDVRRLCPELDVGPLFTHTAYLINLGSLDPVLLERSIAALADELVRGRELGATGVVTHIGTDTEGDPVAAAARIGAAVDVACGLAGAGSDGLLLLENSAGAGNSFGGSFAELGLLFGELDDRGLACGMCLDTCHAHAYGHDLSSAEAWRVAVEELHGCCGKGRLRLLHANDCGFPLGAKRDRHAWIGDGAIGYAGFEAMVCHPALADVPAVMEMPGEAPDKDIENVRRLKTARDACA